METSIIETTVDKLKRKRKIIFTSSIRFHLIEFNRLQHNL